MSGPQRRLWEALSERDRRVADMYLGALRTLADEGNPDRHALAAHGLRELMEKMPPVIGVEGAIRGRGLTDKVRELRDQYLVACRDSESFADDVWRGDALDEPARTYLVASGALFVSMDEEHRSRLETAREFVRKLDPYPSAASSDLEATRAREWKKLSEFFESVSHHKRTPTDEEFVDRLRATEVWLRDYLVPRSFEVQDELDSIITEAEERRADT